jgi:carboxymethylenebutenolidase
VCSYGFSAASANYGGVPGDAVDLLVDACPLVASFGGSDKSQKGAAEKLEKLLVEAGIDHDVKEYPEATHSFMNQIDDTNLPFVFRFAGRLTGGTEFSPEATADARKRIVAFFHKHLG